MAKAQADRQQRIKSLSDTRAGGGFSAEEAPLAAAAAERISGRLGAAASVEAVDRVVAGFFGLGVSEEEMARIAVASEVSGGAAIDLRERADRRLDRARRALSANSGAIDSRIRRESLQADASARAAAVDRSAGGSIDVEQFIRDLPGGAPGDPERLARIAQGLRGIKPADVQAHLESQGVSRVFDAVVGASRDLAELDETARQLKRKEGIDATRNEVRQAQFINQALDRAARKMEEAATRIEQAATRTLERPTNDYRGARFIGPDADSHRRRTHSGGNIDWVRQNERR